MSWVAAAIGGGALLGAGGSILGSKSQSKAMKSAANTQAQSADAATQAQLDMFNMARGDLSPYRNIGQNALSQLNYLTTGQRPTLGFDDQQDLQKLQGAQNLSPEDQERLQYLLAMQKDMQGFQPTAVEKSPLYQLQMDDATKAINRQFAARGMYGSSGATNALSDAYRRLGAEESERQYGRVAGLANYGLGASNTAAQGAMQTGNAMAGIQQNLGNNLAQNQMMQGQNRASMYSNLGALPMQAYNQYQMGQFLNK